MAPEQMLNDVVIQSDYYAMGALGVHLLTGVEPYKMESLEGAFELDYMGAIEAHAPETSKAMSMLIGHLLAPVPSERPINAIALLDEIRQIQRGRSPVPAIAKSIAKQDSWLSAFFKKVSVGIKKLLPRPKFLDYPRRAWSKWPKTDGVIRAVYNPLYIGDEHYRYVEYTFDANDRTWRGSCRVARAVRPPCSCVVIYNPENPRFNNLIRIEKQENIPGERSTNHSSNGDVSLQ